MKFRGGYVVATSDGKKARRLLKKLYLEWIERIEDGHHVTVTKEQEYMVVHADGYMAPVAHKPTGRGTYTIEF